MIGRVGRWGKSYRPVIISSIFLKISNILLEISCFSISIITYFDMRTGFVVLAGLLAVESAASNLKLDATGCKLNRKVEREEVQCPCAGGSGNYDWHFDQLPENWKHEQGRLYTQNGKFEQKKVFGTKVQVIDKDSKQSVKRSLFFTVQNGKLRKVADHDYDFDVKNLVQDRRERDASLGGRIRSSDDEDRVKRIFDGADGIGGGCGLKKLRPYFGGNGLYQGDDRNPFRDRLPSNEQVDRVIDTGRSKDVRELVVNTARSGVGCRDIGGFLEKVFQKIRSKIGYYKDDLETTKKNTKSIQDQIQFLGEELKQAEAKQTNIKDLLIQLQKLQSDSTQIQEDKNRLKVSLQQANEQIDLLQAEIARNVESVRRIKEAQEEKSRLVTKIDGQIAALELRIKELNAQKAVITKESEVNRNLLNESKTKNDEIQVKVDAIRIAVKEIREKLKVINENYDSIQGKILEAQRSLKQSDNQQRKDEIKQRVAFLREKLTTGRARINGFEPTFKDLSENYDDIEKIRDSHYNRCYRSLYNDDREQFKEDDDDGVQFYGREGLDKYIQKVYGKERRRQSNRYGQTQKTVSVDQRGTIGGTAVLGGFTSNPNLVGGVIGQIPAGPVAAGPVAVVPVAVGPAVVGTTSGTAVAGEKQNDDKNKGERLKMKRTHIFSPAWIKAHGSVYDDNFDEQRGRRFVENDFECDIGNIVNVGSFNGKVVSINKNVAKVTNEKGEQCTLYLGGCTRIETVNKPLPKSGDEIYWKGTSKGGREYNAHHISCI